MYKLTQEGKHYLQKGFPEKHLLQMLRNGRKKLSETRLDRKDMAVFWAKKNKWIKIDGNDVILTFFGRMAMPFQKMDIEKALSDIERQGSCDARYVKELLGRNLIEEVGKENLSLKLKNIFWKKDEMGQIDKNKTISVEMRDLRRQICNQQKTIGNLQEYMSSLERRLRNIEQRR